MKKYIISIHLILLATMLVSLSLQAATTGNVNATVIAQNISVSVTDGSVNYGTLSLSGTANTTSTGGNHDSQTATNDGNITETFNIKGANTTAWTLSATAGAEQYTHKFCVLNCDTTPTWTALTTNYATLANNIATSGTQAFDLQIGTPTTTASYTQQSAVVTVQAIAGS